MLEATSTGKGCGNETRLDGPWTARPKFARSCGSVEHCRRSVCEKCGFVFNSKDSKRGRKTGLMKLSKSVTYTELVIDRLNLVCTTMRHPYHRRFKYYNTWRLALAD